MPAADGTTGRSTPRLTPRSARVKPSARAVGQIMTALKNSENAAGPTMTEIVKFVSAALAKPATKRQICTALKRGVEFGIIKRKRGHYLVSSPEENHTKLSQGGKLARSRFSCKVEKTRSRAPIRSRRSSVSSRCIHDD